MINSSCMRAAAWNFMPKCARCVCQAEEKQRQCPAWMA
jgi:hypothetical protein